MISICIPTCHRPALLKLALASVIEQRHRPLEILIGDDSEDDDTEAFVSRIAAPDRILISYHRNKPRLGQAANVNGMFDRARGDLLLLLHDDDLLCPGGLDLLVQAWHRSRHPRCIYGRQMVINAQGHVLEPESDAWNARYFRTFDHSGPQASGLVAAIWQQVPNNCYLIESSAARTTRYRPESEVGQCVDAEFVIRLSRDAPPNSFVLLDAPISKYRLTPNSIARAKDINRRQDLFFDFVQSIDGDAAIEAAKITCLRRIGVGAALDAAVAGRRALALRIILSQFYTRPMISRWTAYRLACALSPSLGQAIKRRIDHYGGRDVIESGASPEHGSSQDAL